MASEARHQSWSAWVIQESWSRVGDQIAQDVRNLLGRQPHLELEARASRKKVSCSDQKKSPSLDWWVEGNVVPRSQMECNST